MAFFGLGISACLRTESGRKAELRERAEELVPADAQILVISYGDCVELAASSSRARAGRGRGPGLDSDAQRRCTRRMVCLRKARWFRGGRLPLAIRGLRR